MKKEVLNSLLIGFLLSFTVLFLFSFLTIFNKNYIRRYLDKYNYYQIKYNDIKEQVEYYDNENQYEIYEEDVKEDIIDYVSNNFNDFQVYRYENNIVNDIYNKNIRFNNFFIKHSNYNVVKIIVIVVMICLIIVTFELYLNLSCEKYNFLFMSGIFGLILNYIMYKSFYFNNEIIDYLYNKYMLYYLIANIVQIVLSIYLYLSVNKLSVKRK